MLIFYSFFYSTTSATDRGKSWVRIIIKKDTEFISQDTHNNMIRLEVDWESNWDLIKLFFDMWWNSIY